MDNILTKSPIDSRLFVWVAQYNNDEYFYEYDNKFNEFNDIKKDILKCFGMIGMDMIMTYDVATGIFDICGRKLSFMFKDENNNEIKLTDTGNIYNDCISYKSAETVLIGREQGQSSIKSYNFGYKIKLNNFNLKIIIHIPLDGKINIDISISSDNDTSGNLFIIRNDELYTKQFLSLTNKQTSTINWIVV